MFPTFDFFGGVMKIHDLTSWPSGERKLMNTYHLFRYIRPYPHKSLSANNNSTAPLNGSGAAVPRAFLGLGWWFLFFSASVPVPLPPTISHVLRPLPHTLAAKFRVMPHHLFIPKLVLNSLLEDLILG